MDLHVYTQMSTLPERISKFISDYLSSSLLVCKNYQQIVLTTLPQWVRMRENVYVYVYIYTVCHITTYML